MRDRVLVRIDCQNDFVDPEGALTINNPDFIYQHRRFCENLQKGMFSRIIDVADMHNNFKISEAFFRRNSLDCGYIVSAGLGEVLEWLDNWHLGKDDIDWLRLKKNSAGSRLYSDDFVNFVKNEKLAINVKAVPEGELVFANEPLYSISGPSWQVEVVEAALLNVVIRLYHQAAFKRRQMANAL